MSEINIPTNHIAIAKTKENPEDVANRCSAYCVASSFDNASLMEFAKTQGLTTIFKNANVIYCNLDNQPGDVFYFAYGVLVTWGLSREQEQAVLQATKAFRVQATDVIDYDHYLYYFAPTPKVNGNEITLPSGDVNVKLAVSHALAQSAKLGIFEGVIANTIQKTRYIPDSLANRGKIPLSRKAITKMMGQLFIERSMVNLHTDILDTPDFFWDHAEFLPLYTMISKDLDIDSRAEVLNARLDTLKELFDMLGSELNHRHSSTLEWVVILLIAMEITLTVSKDVLKLF